MNTQSVKYWFAVALLLLPVNVAVSQSAPIAPAVVDFRYAPPWWQTCIGFPDDWQKTLVGKDGSLLYDYPGRYSGFGVKILASLNEGEEWVKQELASPRVPIVRTLKRRGAVEIEEEAFAIPASALPKPRAAIHAGQLERVSEISGQKGWAAPKVDCDPAFHNVGVGFGKSIEYRLRAPRKQQFTVIFGLCEGWHTNAGQRMVDLQVEGKTLQTVDPVAEMGRNMPRLFPFVARDENGDGLIDLAVAAAKDSPDKNTILNVLWVFAGTNVPPLSELLLGRSSQAALAHLDCSEAVRSAVPPRYDLVVLRLKNRGQTNAVIVPQIAIDTDKTVTTNAAKNAVAIGSLTTLFCSEALTEFVAGPKRSTLKFSERALPAGGEQVLVFCAARGEEAAAPELRKAVAFRKQAERFWQKADLPYGRIEVPDAGVQALVDSSIRNIYQAREIKKGLPAFQVGPTCYRGLWVVDGSFLLEAVAYLGRTTESRKGIQYLLSFQREDGGFMLMNGHWKETGIVLWAVARHARLTGDKAWLREVWPKLERGFAYIRTMREMASKDPAAPNYRLIPDGFSDGGLGESKPEFTNIYWTLAGLRAAVEAARWLGQTAQAEDWQREYDDFLATFRRAAQGEQRTDAHGHSYVPIRMGEAKGISPQRAQWAFCHAVFPGGVFRPDDPLVLGNMKMLEATEQEGMVFGTGWIADGIWNYFASFYAHAWLWLGRGDKSAESLYAFANHASPLLCWREEHMPQGKGAHEVGDMPHNWASAEFIRLVRHSLVLERSDELHLCEGLPQAWLVPGKAIRLRDIETDFGPLSLTIQTTKDGREAEVSLAQSPRNPPKRIVLHLDRWSARRGILDLLPSQKSHRTVPLHYRPQSVAR